MAVTNISFEAGYLTISFDVGVPIKIHTSAFLGSDVAPADFDLIAGLAAASKGVVQVYEEIVDCSGGGSAQTQALVTLPVGAVILEVATICTEAFNGDTTKTFEVGITGNTDLYIDPVDCPVTLAGVMSIAIGTNQDQKTVEVLAASTPIIATWTNTAAMTAGKMKVRIVYA